MTEYVAHKALWKVDISIKSFSGTTSSGLDVDKMTVLKLTLKSEAVNWIHLAKDRPSGWLF